MSSTQSHSSIARARRFSSAAVSSGTLPISRRYMRTGSSMPAASSTMRRAASTTALASRSSPTSMRTVMLFSPSVAMTEESRSLFCSASGSAASTSSAVTWPRRRPLLRSSSIPALSKVCVISPLLSIAALFGVSTSSARLVLVRQLALTRGHLDEIGRQRGRLVGGLGGHGSLGRGARRRLQHGDALPARGGHPVGLLHGGGDEPRLSATQSQC